MNYNVKNIIFCRIKFCDRSILKVNEKNWVQSLNNFFLNIVSNIICQIIILLLPTIGTPIISAITLIKKSNGENIDVIWWILFSLFIIFSICNIIAAILHFIYRYKRPFFPAFKSDISYNYIRTELFFCDRENIKCNRDVSFNILCEKMRFMRKQFTWSGDGYKGTILDENTKNKGFKIDDSIRKLPPQICDIEFDCEKHRGDIVDYKITSELEDTGHVMQPILSQHISQTTKELTLILTVPKGLVKNVYSVAYADVLCKNRIGKPEKVEIKTYGDKETYEITRKNPRLLHFYRLEWEWQ